MIVVCDDFQKRLDMAWYKLSRLEQERVGHSISQYDLDDACVTSIEGMVALMELQAGHNKVRKG